MRTQNQLLSSRARAKPRYALFPLEGIPFSRLPEWPEAQVRVLAAPSLGAGFVEYLVELQEGERGGHAADGEIEFFAFVISGSLDLMIDERSHAFAAGGYALVPPGCDFSATASSKTRLLVLRKRYEAAPAIAPYAPLVGAEEKVSREIYYGDPGARLQTLIPDDLEYDLAMNIFTFDAGHSLPVTETHVMEHGLYVLQGKGMYFLDDAWLEVEVDDFIWMGPFCPQSYYATGPEATRYIYYKNVNREIPL
jgi:(S)-ureidoglycine aminohydrolase